MDSESGQQRKVTILVVEDQEPVLRVVERSLTRSGFQVITAMSPQEGLSKLAEHGSSVDMLLTDVVMPQMSGPDLAAAARQHAPDIRILFMSGYSGDSLLDRIAELGEASVVEKPFRPAELVAKVRKVMGEVP